MSELPIDKISVAAARANDVLLNGEWGGRNAFDELITALNNLADIVVPLLDNEEIFTALQTMELTDATSDDERCIDLVTNDSTDEDSNAAMTFRASPAFPGVDNLQVGLDDTTQFDIKSLVDSEAVDFALNLNGGRLIINGQTVAFEGATEKGDDPVLFPQLVNRSTLGSGTNAAALDDGTGTYIDDPDHLIRIDPGQFYSTLLDEMVYIYANPGADEVNNAGRDSGLTKSIELDWEVGNGGGRFSSTAFAANDPCYLFIIRNDDYGTYDAGFDDNETASNIPAGWSVAAMMIAFQLDDSINIPSFINFGHEIHFDTPQEAVITESTEGRMQAALPIEITDQNMSIYASYTFLDPFENSVDNLTPYSNDFTAVAGRWSWSALDLPDGVVQGTLSPRGVSNEAWEVTEANSFAAHGLVNISGQTYTSSQEYTLSFYFKPQLRSHLTIQVLDGATTRQVNYNTGTETVDGLSNVDDASMEEGDNGWWRLVMNFTGGGGTGNYQFLLRDSLGSSGYTGDDTQVACEVFGFQLEAKTDNEPSVYADNATTASGAQTATSVIEDRPVSMPDFVSGDDEGGEIANQTDYLTLTNPDYELGNAGAGQLIYRKQSAVNDSDIRVNYIGPSIPPIERRVAVSGYRREEI